jgi:hypothetical protein
MTYRHTGTDWRNEFGMPTNDVPRPWRLLWRAPTQKSEEPKPKRGSRKAEEDSDGDE